MSTCLFFVFASLLEFAIVNVLSRKEIRRMVTIRRTNQMKTRRREENDMDEVGRTDYLITSITNTRREEENDMDEVGRTNYLITSIN